MFDDSPQKITLQFSRKINLGNYESAEFSAMVTRMVSPGDDFEAEVADGVLTVKTIVYEAIAEEAAQANHQDPIIRRFIAGKQVMDSLDNF